MASGPKLAHSGRVEPWFFRANMEVATNEGFFEVKALSGVYCFQYAIHYYVT
jgi:hypothetical protein